jgi:hypothetical protein
MLLGSLFSLFLDQAIFEQSPWQATVFVSIQIATVSQHAIETTTTTTTTTTILAKRASDSSEPDSITDLQ